MFDKERIAKMKKGVLIVNNARGAIMDTQAVVDACNSGHIAGIFNITRTHNQRDEPATLILNDTSFTHQIIDLFLQFQNFLAYFFSFSLTKLFFLLLNGII